MSIPSLGRKSCLVVVLLALGIQGAEAQEGLVLYTRGSLYGAGEIHLAMLDSGGNVVSDTGIYGGGAHEPKFSPDGNRIAFVRDSDKKLILMDLDGGNQEVHTTCAGDTYPLASWRHPDTIYLNGEYHLLRYHIPSAQTDRVLSSVEKFRELDIAQNLRGVHGGMPPVYAFDLNAGTDGFAYDRCGGSISPDGSRLTNMRSDHQGFYLRSWGGAFDIEDNIDTPTAFEALDPQFSGNSVDHLLVNIKNAGDHWNVWLYEISTNTWKQITDANVENSASDFFLGIPVQPRPELTLDPVDLAFSAVVGQGNPPGETVSVGNRGPGVLEPVHTGIRYEAGSGWLTVMASGSGNAQSLENTVDASGLEAGEYAATVEVSCDNASNSPVSYPVSLNVQVSQQNQPPVVDAGDDILVELSRPGFLFGTVSDDGIPGPLTVIWSQLSGPGTAVFTDTGSAATNVSFSATGEYRLRLGADDGELQSHDDVTATVTEDPAIVLQSPDGGEVWTVGSVQPIRWTTAGVNDVALWYSTDDGETWKVIEYTVDTVNTPDWWGHYPWTVPDEPSDLCRVRVVAYNAERPVDLSAAPFTITAQARPDGGTPGGDDQVETIEGSCSCGVPAAPTSWILLLAGMLRAYRWTRKTRSTPSRAAELQLPLQPPDRHRRVSPNPGASIRDHDRFTGLSGHSATS